MRGKLRTGLQTTNNSVHTAATNSVELPEHTVPGDIIDDNAGGGDKTYSIMILQYK